MSLLKALFGFASFCTVPALLAQSATVTTLSITSGGSLVNTVKEAVDEVTLTATVTVAGSAATPPGQVNFCEVKAPPLKCTDIRLLGTVALLSGGRAVFNFYPGPGIHTYQAVFLGTYVEAASSSSTATLDVTAPTVTTITSSGNPGNYTLNATVTGTGLTVPPTATMSFEDTSNSNYVLAAAPLVGNQAPPNFSISSIAALKAPNPGQLLSADFNSDGKADLAMFVTQTNSVHQLVASVVVYLGNGDGTFTAAPNTSIAENNEVIGLLATGDFNGDGKPDVIVGINSTQIRVFLGNGDGTFNQGQILPYTEAFYLSPTGAYTVAVGDFNGDGVEDLAVTEIGIPPNAQVAIYLGNGDGTFTLKSTTPTGNGSEPAVAGDFNGDGILDLAVVNSGNGNIPTTSFPEVQGSVTILLGNGDGTFTTVPAAPATGWSPLAVAAGDFNGDGILDLAVANDGQYGIDTPGTVPGVYPGSVTVLLGNGDGTFTSAASPATALYPDGIAVGDFNGDGKADLVTSSTSGGVGNPASVLLGNGDGTFALALELATGEVSTAVVAKDFNDDGLTDIAVSNNGSSSVSILLSQLGSQSAAATVSGISIVGTGAHQVDASYSGDSSYQPSTSATTGLTAEPLPTTLTLTTNPANTSYGLQVVLTATISSGNALTQNHVPSGTVIFSVGSLALGTATVSGGVATFNTTSLPVGTDTVVAAYSGDANFIASSGSATDTIGNYATADALAVAPNPGGAGLTTTLTATVTGVATTLVPTGAVTFFDGATQIGSVAVSASGHAVFTTTTLAIGVHSLTASYGGSAVFTVSTSPPVAETIIKPDFSIALAAPSITLAKYQNTTTTITLSSIGAFADTVSLACGNLPAYLTCVPTPSSISLTANGSTTASLYLDTDSIIAADGESSPLAQSGPRSPAVLAFLLLPIFTVAIRRRRRNMRLSLILLAFLALPLALTLASCGGSVITPVPGVAPGTYTIPITATAVSTGLTHTAQLTLTVTP